MASPVLRKLGRSTAFGAAAYVTREVTATLRVAAAAPSGWGMRAHRARRASDDLVIFIHGLLATAGAFAPAIRHIRDEIDVDVRTFTYLPGADLDTIATRIERAVKTNREATRVHLVGHSLGGLAARWYVQTFPRDARVVQTISIASPFHGIDLADLLPDALRSLVLPLAGQLDRLVNEAPQHLSRVPHLSIIGDMDPIIRPITTGMLPGAPSYVLHDIGHNSALFSSRLHDVLVKEIRRYGIDESLVGQ